MKRYDRGVSPQGNANCEAGSKAGMSYEFMHRAHRASTEGRKMGGSVGVWGTPCSIQRGLTRRLCILLVCTDPLSALAPKLQERNRSVDENRTIFVIDSNHISAPAGAVCAQFTGGLIAT